MRGLPRPEKAAGAPALIIGKPMDIDHDGYWDDSLPEEDIDVDVDLEKLGFPRTGIREPGPLAFLEKVVPRIVEGPAADQQPEDVPFLGNLVPGADSCAVFAISPSNRRLYPVAISNLSTDAINAFTGDGSGNFLRLYFTAAGE